MFINRDYNLCMDMSSEKICGTLREVAGHTWHLYIRIINDKPAKERRKRKKGVEKLTDRGGVDPITVQFVLFFWIFQISSKWNIQIYFKRSRGKLQVTIKCWAYSSRLKP